MTEQPTERTTEHACCGGKHKHSRVPLYASVAANIFLAAFVLGQAATGPHPGAPGTEPPPPAQDAMQPGQPSANGGPGQGMAMGPRRGGGPFFGMQSLLTPEEMKAHEEEMRQNFEKVGTLRKDFAAKLAAGPVSKDEVLAHFAAIDAVLDPVRKETQTQAADKISSLSDEDRKKFAEGLQQAADRPMPPPPGMGGMGPMGNGPGNPPEAGAGNGAMAPVGQPPMGAPDMTPPPAPQGETPAATPEAPKAP